MHHFNSDYFMYRNQQLYAEDIPVSDLIQQYGTPVYIYSASQLKKSYERFSHAFEGLNFKIFFAVKSLYNISIIKLFHGLGAGMDINSEGEFYRAESAGVNPKDMLLTGVGKTAAEIKNALVKGVRLIKAESAEEIFLINEIAGSLGIVAPVAIRVNPDVDAKTHPYTTTGLYEYKFGVDTKTAYELYRSHQRFPNIRFTGIDMHIGSQIKSVEPYIESIGKLSMIVKDLREYGLSIDHFDIGGGFGVAYNNDEQFPLEEFAKTILPTLKSIECEIYFEPGRFFSANAGILAAEVLYTKDNGVKKFLVTDAAMNDLLRPSIYGSFHYIQPVKTNLGRKQIIADIVGPICESGDFIARGRVIAECERGDHLAIMSAGAYGMTMASNYNARRRAPEVLVEGSNHTLIRSRETLEHLVYDEKSLLK